jgi:hypothetical protein
MWWVSIHEMYCWFGAAVCATDVSACISQKLTLSATDTMRRNFVLLKL